MSSTDRSEKLFGLAPLARRDVMKVGAGAAALGLAAVKPASAAACPEEAELFAFHAPDCSDLVFAVAFPMAADRSQLPAIRLHAGSKAWTIDSGDASNVTAAAGARVFVGSAAKPVDGARTPHHLIVVSAPSSAFASGDLAPWAEITGKANARLRVGNPMVAELLSRDPSLARVFHKAHPNHDRDLFAIAIAERVAARGGMAVPADRQAYGVRLADLLLPDVLSFDPGQPVGFSFAAQNGRHPSDATGEVIDTVLSGVVAPRHVAAGLFKSAPAFPYFASQSA